MHLIQSLSLLLALSVLFATATEDSLANSIKQRLKVVVEEEMKSEAEVEGIDNCYNKCSLLFNNMAYSILTQSTNGQTNEYRACIVGCSTCQEQLNDNDHSGACLTVCKDIDWLAFNNSDGTPNPIVKGVIEPDKACQMGCVENLCQGVCTGGTTDQTVTKQNANAWWNGSPADGCSIKTGSVRPGGFYAQEGTYAYSNSPLGAGGQNTCCSNGIALCKYKGPKGVNYQNVFHEAQTACNNVKGAGKTVSSICKFVLNASNCGNPITT